MSDPEAGDANGHGAPVHGPNPAEGGRMTDERRHAHNGSEVSARPKVEERAQPAKKPILEWTREDWQRWAAGLNQSQDEPVEDEPVEGQRQPVRPRPVQHQQAQEPVPAKAAAGIDTVAEESAEAEEPPSETGPVPEHSPDALPLSPGLTATRPWPGQSPEGPLRTARARSALGLMMLAVVVGALVAGLVTFIIVVSSLVLRRVLGS